MEDTSWRKPVDHIEDLRKEILFYRMVLCCLFVSLILATVALIAQAVSR